MRGKKINGTKRHLVVDTLGLVLAGVVPVASLQDRDGAKFVLNKMRNKWPRLKLIWADGGYAGQLIDWVREVCGWLLEIVKRNSGWKGFVLLPRRWVVERPFSWLGNYRRLSKDYEYATETSEAMIYAAMVHLMIQRLAPKPKPRRHQQLLLI